jgi:uncharacterized protein
MIQIRQTPASNIFTVPVAGDYLLYSPFNEVTALINRSALTTVQTWFAEKQVDVPDTIQPLISELSCVPIIIPSVEKGSLRPAFLGIIPTRACNMSCVYCDFDSNKGSQLRMDPAMAVAAVEWMANYAKTEGYQKLEIHFFGGEPFVAKELVEIVVHRGRALAAELGLIPHFEVSTNGLFDAEWASFVGDYFDAVVLSFDGFREFHDRQRPIGGSRGSFDAVVATAKRLSQSSTELCLRCCITRDNVSQMAEITRWFCTDFSPSVINFEIITSNPQSVAAGLQPPDPYEFTVNYVHAWRVAQSYNISVVSAAIDADAPRHTACPVGKDTLIISPDGRISSCYLPRKEWQARGLDLDVGHLDSLATMKIDQDAIQRLRQLVTDKPRCENCFCRWNCAGGCHVSQSYPECSINYNDFCSHTRVVMACKLLEELGLRDKVDELLENPTAMQNLAKQPSDCLEDWRMP